MSMSSHLLDRGIGLWKSGQKLPAHKLFETIIYNDKCNEAAWIWYIYTLGSDAEKIAALETFLVIFPQHVTGKKALASLKAEASKLGTQIQSSAAVSQTSYESAPQYKPVSTVVPRPVQQPRARSLSWLFLILGSTCLLIFAAILLSRYKSLQFQNQQLASTNQLIIADFNTLKSDYGALQSEKNQLTAEYDFLNGRYSTLNSNYLVLEGQYQDLSTKNAELQNSYDSLLNNYNSTVQSFSAFKDIAIAPPYIYTRGRMVHLVFQKLDGSLLKWDIGSDWLEYHLRQGDKLRANLDYDLRLYNKFTSETYNVVDDRKFVDSTPFTNLIADLYNHSPDEETFIKEVWNIVAQLTAYASEIKETPRFPMETLLSGGGDCEDHAILFASMILAAPTQWQVKFVYMDGEHPAQPETMNHVIVQVITSSRSHLIEATSKDTMEPYPEVFGWFYPVNQADD